MLRYFAFIAALSFSASLYSQTLYMPRDIKKAYKNGTRSMDGKPASRYWQNRARYDIIINTAPPERAVRGTETITYFNNSPDSLRNIIIKLLLNTHKPGAPRNQGAQDDYLTSGIHIDKLTVNGKEMPWQEIRFFSQGRLSGCKRRWFRKIRYIFLLTGIMISHCKAIARA